MNEGGNLQLLETMVTGLFDHSGTFPPAARTLEEALRDLTSFPRNLERPWLVGSDLVLDKDNAARVAALDLTEFGYSANARLCLLVPSSRSVIRETVQALRLGSERDSIERKIASLEVKVTSQALGVTLAELEEEALALNTLLVIEPDLSTDQWAFELDRTVKALAQSSARVALKCRCTGPTAIGAERLSSALIAASDALLPFKVTGGLHHPIVEPERYGNQIGFLNLVVGWYLRRGLQDGIRREALTELLVNSDSSAFSFAGQLCYRDFTLSKSQVEGVKAGAAIAIGSCSLTEPDDDLERLFGRPQ